MTWTISLFGKAITCDVTRLDQGIHVLLTGGDKSHIGAVSTAEPDGTAETQRFPGHKDQYISAPWAEKIAQTAKIRTTVVCGIHYDTVTKVQIETILKETDALLEEILASRLVGGGAPRAFPTVIPDAPVGNEKRSR